MMEASETMAKLAERGDQPATDSAVNSVVSRRVGVVVLGMHRSGTSALTRMLGLLGCTLPSTLMGAAEHNPKGHWESQPVADLNDEILALAGTQWDDWLPVNARLPETLVWPQLVEKGRQVLRGEFADAPLFVLKDPRICKLAGFWMAVMAAEQVEPVFVLPIRNPIEVAQSLATRDGIDEAHGLLFWLRHVLAAEGATRGRKRVFTDYAGLLADREALAGRLSDGLGVVWPRISALSGAEISDFLTSDLRHHVSDMAELGENPGISPWLRQAYAVLLDWARHGEKSSDYPVLDRIARAFDDAAPAFARPMVNGDRAAQRAAQAKTDNATLAAERDHVTHRLGEVEGELARMMDLHHNLAQERDATAARLGEVEAEWHQACAERDARTAERDGLVGEQAVLAEERHRNSTLGLELESLQNRLADQDSALRQKQEEAAQAWAEVAVMREAAAALNARNEQLEQQAEALSRSLQDSEAWVFRLGGERRQAEQRENRLTRDVQRLTSEMNAFKREAAGLQEALAAEKSLPRGSDAGAEEELQRLRDALSGQEAASTARTSQMEQDLAQAQAARRMAEDQAVQAEALKLDLEHKLAERFAELAEMAKLLRKSEDELKANQAAANTDRVDRLEDALVVAQKAKQFAEDQALHSQASEAELEQRLATLARDSDGLVQAGKTELAATKASLDERFAEIAKLTRLYRDQEQKTIGQRTHVDWLRQVHAVVSSCPQWWSIMPAKWRRPRELRRLQSKGLFDGNAYLARYPDVAGEAMDPLRHYIMHGITEGRSI